MRLPFLLFLTTLLCALSEIGMALHAIHWNAALAELELSTLPMSDSRLTVLRALNVALPIGVICLLLLLRIRKTAGFNGFALWAAAALHLAGVNLNLSAAERIFGANQPLETLAWWAPAGGR